MYHIGSRKQDGKIGELHQSDTKSVSAVIESDLTINALRVSGLFDQEIRATNFCLIVDSSITVESVRELGCVIHS